MGLLTIKKINNNNINIELCNQYYLLRYYTNYLKLSSISLKLKGVTIVEKDGYYIYITDKKSINDINLLDTFLSDHIPNYKCILHNSFNKNLKISNYLFFKKNNYLTNFIKVFKNNELYINIIKLKKTASYTFPIVYVL
jgi:hypothetical protein